MAEDKKKTTSGSVPGKDLTSKIATAYRNLPPEQREKPAPDQSDIQNPELDKAFDKMVEMYKVRRPERENSVVTFPGPPTLRVPKPAADEGEEYECPECGHSNPGAHPFCGMCGAAREDAVVAPPRSVGSEQLGMPAESGVKHHHHHYHHQHYRNNPYLLLAVVLLLGVIAWQQWQYQQAGPASSPAVQVQPRVPAQTQPSSSIKPATPAEAPATEPSSKPAKKPGPRVSTPRPANQQGEPPGQQVRSPKVSSPVAPPLAPYQALTKQPSPALPTFSSTPEKPAAAR